MPDGTRPSRQKNLYLLNKLPRLPVGTDERIVTIGRILSREMPGGRVNEAAPDQARSRSPNRRNMRTPYRTITLTVLGGDPSLTDVVRVPGRAAGVKGPGVRAMKTRRALLVIRPEDDAHGLIRRLRDSITRLAGGAAADAGRLAGQIVNDLHRTAPTDAAYRGWTLTHIFDGPYGDPYAPRLSRLKLIDTPARRGRVGDYVRGRVGQRLRRANGQPQEHLTRIGSGRRSPACLS